MLFISVNPNHYAIIDDSDALTVLRHKWHYVNGYATTAIYRPETQSQQTLSMHRMIMGSPTGLEVDHINGDRLDNRRENLRVCSHANNASSKRRGLNNTSRYKGVAWVKSRAKWMAYIQPKGRLINLGYYKNRHDAALAYNRAAQKWFGEYAMLNTVETNG